jgi:hypothetical protein
MTLVERATEGVARKTNRWLAGRNGGVYNNGCWYSKTCSGHYYVCCDRICGNGACACMCRGTIYV